MSAMTPPALPEPQAPASQTKVLRKLFLTLFLRGRSARGLQKDKAPGSIGSKLGLTLLFYGAFGLIALQFGKLPLFALSLYLHGMTTVFLGMYVASSAGEVLFNNEESDILMHRPVTAKALLYAKITVLVQISLWLAGAFNVVGFLVGMKSPHGGGLFVVVHAISIMLEALFCTSSVVLVYQLCLRFFGRERLENLMTMVQVLAAIAMVLGGQIIPQLFRFMEPGASFNTTAWWIYLLPPAWFAGFDDALMGTGAMSSWALGGCGVLATTVACWLAFDKLSGDYQSGLQSLNESAPTQKRSEGKRWLVTLVKMPPFSWWLRDSVSRASFMLTAAYLLRDREMKLRIYPSLAPMLVMPVIFLLQGMSSKGGAMSGSFGIAFAGSYLGFIPLQGLALLQFSQQWQAADLFRLAPLRGPGQLCHGARKAILLLLTLPMLLFFMVIGWFISPSVSNLLLMLPGLIVLPVYALLPNLGGAAIPLSQPVEGAQAANRWVLSMGAMIFSMILAGLAIWSRHGGWFWWFIAVESVLVVVVYMILRLNISKAGWPKGE